MLQVIVLRVFINRVSFVFLRITMWHLCNRHTVKYCCKAGKSESPSEGPSWHSPQIGSAIPFPIVTSTMSKTFRGVVFYGPRDIRVEDRPFPNLKDWSENDAIVKVKAAGIPLLRPSGKC